jgi:hypothetical protein
VKDAVSVELGNEAACSVKKSGNLEEVAEH